LITMLERLQLEARPVKAGDTLSIRTDLDRRRAEELLDYYRRLPPEQRRARPALLNGLGRLEFAVNDFEGAQKLFREAAAGAPAAAARAEAHYNAYRAALERLPEGRDEALASLLEALKLAPDRFAPFPMADYEPVRVLGAGGFGVTFLARHRLSQ